MVDIDNDSIDEKYNSKSSDNIDSYQENYDVSEIDQGYYEKKLGNDDNITNVSDYPDKIIQKLPTFYAGDRKINDPRIDSDKYLDYKEYEPFKLSNFPLFFWFLGVVFIGFAITLIINIILHKYEKNFFDGFIGKYFWEYIVLLFIFGFGITFFFVAQYESIVINKLKGIMILSRFDLFKCGFTNLEIQIKNVNSIFPVSVQSARNTSMTRSCLTQIGITYDNSNTVFIFKSFFSYFTIKNVVKLRAFLYQHIQSFEDVKKELDGMSTQVNVIQNRLS